MSRYKSLFSYYGGKSKIVHRYSPPKHSTIIEPFAGGAAYSLKHCETHKCIINEIDPKVIAIWRFILSDDAFKEVSNLPDGLKKGTKISEEFSSAPKGLIYLLQAEANKGTQGARGNHDQVTSMGEACSSRIKPRLLHFIPRLKGSFVLTTCDYASLQNRKATWFIDPPYNNAAGNRYRQPASGIDFNRLGKWCRSRNGHVIVCENEGADWLPFIPLVERQGVRSRYQKSKAMEVVWEKG